MEMKHKTFGTVGSPRTLAETQESKAQESRQTQESDLQSLIELGCIKDNITLGTLQFRMRSLNATERLDLAKFLGDNPSVDSLFKFNVKLLAGSIETINGKPLESYHPDFEKNSDVISMRCEIIAYMQPNVIGKLLDFYNKISERGDATFDIEKIKNL